MTILLEEVIARLRAEIAAKDKELEHHRKENDALKTRDFEQRRSDRQANDYRAALRRAERAEGEIADLKHDIARHLTIASDAETHAAAKDKALAAYQQRCNDLACDLITRGAAKDKEIARLREALAIGRDLVGPWLSGALDDPATCEAMKGDISAFFEAIEGCTSASEDEKEERPGAVDTPANPAAGARPGAGDIPEAPMEKL